MPLFLLRPRVTLASYPSFKLPFTYKSSRSVVLLAPGQYYISGLRDYTNMAASTPTKKHKVAIVGSGNWGSTVAKVVAENTRSHPDLFEEEVHMWVYEEKVQIDRKNRHFSPGSALCKSPQNLSELINTLHENVKYLPGITLPDNLIANPSLTATVKDATILVFNFPHQFVTRICGQLKGNILPYARGFSCIKGVDVSASGVRLISDAIGDQLGIYVGALSGANIASEIALGKFSETTIAYDPPPMDSQYPSPRQTPRTNAPANKSDSAPKPKSNRPSGDLISLPSTYPPLDHNNVRALFHRPYFHVHMVSDVAGVALGGALKNIIALAAGFVDGMGWGDNAKAAMMRVGILEMVKFGNTFFPESAQATTFTQESAGVADVITSSCGGRNFRCAKMSIERGMSIADVEKQELNGQSLQGTLTAREVNALLKAEGMEAEFPLFTAVHNILEGKVKPHRIPELIEKRPGSPRPSSPRL